MKQKTREGGKEGNKEFIAYCQMQMYQKPLKKTCVLRTSLSFLNTDILKNLKIFLRQPCWAGRSAMDPSEEPSSLGGQAGYSGYLKGHVPKLKQVNCTLSVEEHKVEPDTQ